MHFSEVSTAYHTDTAKPRPITLVVCWNLRSQLLPCAAVVAAAAAVLYVRSFHVTPANVTQTSQARNSTSTLRLTSPSEGSIQYPKKSFGVTFYFLT